MSDCLWGALDGVNEDGLAVALAFGGRREVGRGFAVTLLLRYLLEQCADVPQALEAMAAVPVNLSYNIVLVDAVGDAALVHVGAQPRSRGRARRRLRRQPAGRHGVARARGHDRDRAA